MIINPPLTFEEFNSITMKHFVEHYDKIIENIDKNMDKQDKSYHFNFYSMGEKLNYIDINSPQITNAKTEDATKSMLILFCCFSSSLFLFIKFNFDF